MQKVLSNKAISVAFTKVIEKVDRDKLQGVLFNWDDVELNEDGDKLITHPGRDGVYSRGADGGKSYVTKQSFFEWLFSDAPFDVKVYGEAIKTDTEWAESIKEIRQASGLDGR